MEKEIWKDIPEYEGLYQASNLGRIRTCENKITHTKKHGDRVWKQRIMKYRGNNYQTGHRVSLWKNGKPKDYLVARLIGSVFLEESIHTKLTINHKDGNRFNNSIDNLEWITLADNIRHAFRTGLMPTKQIILENKLTGEKKKYMSLSSAGVAIGYNHSYFSYKLKKGKTENKLYRWELL